jgi:hypothetical protein
MIEQYNASDRLSFTILAARFFRFFAGFDFGVGLYAKTTSAMASSAFGTFSVNIGFVIE